MQLCGKCSNYNSDESIFCGHCANRLNNNCPACGFKNLWEQKFCGNCGKQLRTDTELNASALEYGQKARPDSGAAPGAGLPPTAALAPDVSPVGGMAPKTPPETPEPVLQEVSSKGSPMSVQDLTPVQPLSGEARFESYADLEAYALASIEFVNWEQALAGTDEPRKLEEFLRRCQAFIEERILAANGQINASKKNILFVSFKRELSLEASLDQAIETFLRLLAEEFRYPSGLLQLRIGLDIERAKARNPLTSTLERSVGHPGTLTVSEAVNQLIRDRYRMEPIGPVTMGNHTLMFYRVLRPGSALPPVEAVIAPPVAESAPQAPRIDDRGAEPPATPKQPETAQALPSAAASQAPSGIVQPAEPAPAKMQPMGQSAIAQQPEPSEKQSFSPPELPQYESPVLGNVGAARKANLNYENAIEALAAELSGFVAQGATAKGKLVAICAADGLGKSSIVHMVRSRIDPENQQAIWMGGHHYRCFHRLGMPLGYWIELVQNLLSLVMEGQPGREVREQLGKFLGYIYEGEPPSDEMAFLVDLLSVQPLQPLSVESRANLGRIEAFFLAFLHNLAAKRPVVVVMEDLMFADPASLDLLVRLLEKGLLDAPVYLILTQSRDFYAEGKLAELLQKLPYKELIISELNDAEAERFLDEGPLGGQLHTFPPQVIDMILRNAKGLPLYVEEVMRLLHLQEALTVDPETYKFVINREFDFAGLRLPETLPALLRARFGFLGEKATYLLQLASILGEKFAINLLMALAQMEEDEFNESLTTLFNHGFLLPDAVNTGRFRHGLIWETVYAGVDESLRFQMHQLVSEALEHDFNQGVTVNPMLIAYHSENGGMPNRALNYWNLAGIYDGQIGSLVGMNMAMFRALALLEASTAEPLHTQELALRIAEGLGIYNLEEDPDLASGVLEWVFFYRRSEGDAVKLIEPLGFLASAYENKGDFTKALVTLDKALELVDAKAYPLETASLQINRMEYLFTLGRLQQARELMEQGIEPVAASASGSHAASGMMEPFLQARLLKAQILLAQCDNAAIALIEDCLRQARENGLQGLEIALQLTMGQIFLRNGQYERCNHEADGLLSAIESMEDSDWFLAQWGLLAIMYHCELEDWTSASHLVLTVISKSEAVRDYHTWVVAQAYAGYISGKLGKVKEARQLIEQAIGLSSDHRFASAALLGWRFLADFEASCGNHEVAYEISVKALDIANKPDIRNVYESIELTLVCARALMAQGKAKEAGKLLEPIWPHAAKTKWQPLVADCAFEIAQLYKQLAQNVPSDLSRKYLTRSVEFFLKAKGIWLELRHLNHVKKVDAAIPKL